MVTDPKSAEGLKRTFANAVISVTSILKEPSAVALLLSQACCMKCRIVSVLSMRVHISFEDCFLEQIIFRRPLKYVEVLKEFPQLISVGKGGCFPLQNFTVMGPHIAVPLVIAGSLELCFQKEQECVSVSFSVSFCGH